MQGPHTMALGKTRTFVFLEIGILRSLLRVNFPNLRFEDIFPNSRKDFTKEKILGRKFFCPAEDFFYLKFFTKILNFFPKLFVFG